MRSPPVIESTSTVHYDSNGTHLQSREQLDEEYLSAQRAAHESILIGRATAEVVHQQGEQLTRAESLVDDTQYKLDRATRLLKGMTWSGWVGNMFSSLPQPATSSSDSSDPAHVPRGLPSLASLEQLPSSCADAVQAIKNYHANVTVLRDCETKEQQETCKQICDSMYIYGVQNVKMLSSGQKRRADSEAYVLQLQNDLETIRKCQIDFQAQVCGLTGNFVSSTPSVDSSTPQSCSSKMGLEKEELFGRKPVIDSPTRAALSPAKSKLEQVQDEHLNVISASLDELGHIAHSLSTGFDQQHTTIESLEAKSDDVYETSKMVARRTDRLIQQKSWTASSRSVFYATVVIRHVETGKYLSVLGNDLYLVNRHSPISCTFDVHKRHGNIIGLKSRSNHKWMGQSFLTGSLTCSSSTFGRREEWETDASGNWTSPTSDTMTTRLLCTSAGWGQGGYIQVNVSNNFAIKIGGMTASEAKAAAQWTMSVIADKTEGAR
jgi:ElaB/YqjD/DUF883 family membrane-anchored ribosome-binding protein